MSFDSIALKLVRGNHAVGLERKWRSFAWKNCVSDANTCFRFIVTTFYIATSVAISALYYYYFLFVIFLWLFYFTVDCIHDSITMNSDPSRVEFLLMLNHLKNKFISNHSGSIKPHLITALTVLVFYSGPALSFHQSNKKKILIWMKHIMKIMAMIIPCRQCPSITITGNLLEFI